MNKAIVVDNTATSTAQDTEQFADADSTDKNVTKAGITISTADGVELAGTTYKSNSSVRRKARGVVIVAAGVGLLQNQYIDYSTYLASKGWIVITFDYRGIGDSVLNGERQYTSLLRDWGKYDLDACIVWATKQNAQPRIVIVAHSVGGQIIPFAANHTKINDVIAVCSQKGYWRFWGGLRRFKLMFLWYLLPVLVTLFGRLPLQLMGKEADLPAGIAREWGRWGRVRDFVDEKGGSLNFKFAKVSGRFLAISFSDDNFFAPRRSVEALNGLYTNTESSHWHLSPQALDCTEVGHTGFFRTPEKLCPLWERVDSCRAQSGLFHSK